VPRSSASAAPSRPTAGPAQTRADLSTLRPALVAGYDAELPGARAAILARLLGAVGREALPGLVARRPGEASFADGTVVRFPEAATAMFAAGEPGLTVTAGRDDRRAGLGRDVDDPGALVRLLWPGAVLADEVDNSVANLALARADRAARAGLDPRRLGEAEQLVVDGHPLHPCCRTRGGMTVADVLAYAPEHAPVIHLRRLRVPADRWYGTAEPVLYTHPWQAERLRARYPWLTDDGETGPARPLMSLRTVAPIDGGPHVKTAVDVQMTSAVRTVSPAAVHNGPILSALLRELTADLPIDVLAEHGAGAVLVDGQPQRHLAYLRREAPALREGETALPVAMLSSGHLRLVGVHDAYEMMARLGTLLFAPLVAVLARGVALEAHGQNTLVVLRDGRPVRILYRDLGGVRVSARRLRAAGLEMPPLDGDLPSDDPRELRTKLAAAALGTVAGQLIARWRDDGADEKRLWRIVAEAIRSTGTPDAGHLLRDPLPVKATTAMRLAADPLDDQWALFDNPMAA
jgi:siderophore synthetase component